MDPREADDLISRLEREANSLEEYGYRFPALYDAVKRLLELHATKSSESQ